MPADEKHLLNEFSLKLFAAAYREGENNLLSPLSLLLVLALAANGAAGRSRQEFEALTGLPREALNLLLQKTEAALPENEKIRLSSSASLWLNERFKPKPEFLEKNRSYYDAEIFSVPLSEESLEAMNAWVREKSGGRIREITEQLGRAWCMSLLNVLTFKAEWLRPYSEHKVEEAIFRAEDGSKKTVEMMKSRETLLFLQVAGARGFVLPYADTRYGFAALLPPEGMPPEDLLKALDASLFHEMLEKAAYKPVLSGLPKFDFKADLELKDAVRKLGLKSVFDPEKADFREMGDFSSEENLYISKLRQKSYISVGEQGTEAGAASLAEIAFRSALMPEAEEIILDRPFLFFILDLENALPLFIGTFEEPS